MKYYTSRKSKARQDLENWSLLMQKLSRPDTVNSEDVTTHRYHIIANTAGTIHAIVVDDNDSIPMHSNVRAQAQTGSMPDVESAIDNASDATRVKNIIRDNPRAAGYVITPARWMERTLAQLQSDGFDITD